MKLTHLTFATAAVALLGGAAYAQQPTEPADSTPAPASATTQAAPATVSATSTTETATPAVTAGTNASATTFTTMTVTNGPVPDTAENRAKYGQPLSHAGKRTAAKGN